MKDITFSAQLEIALHILMQKERCHGNGVTTWYPFNPLLIISIRHRVVRPTNLTW